MIPTLPPSQVFLALAGYFALVFAALKWEASGATFSRLSRLAIHNLHLHGPISLARRFVERHVYSLWSFSPTKRRS